MEGQEAEERKTKKRRRDSDDTPLVEKDSKRVARQILDNDAEMKGDAEIESDTIIDAGMTGEVEEKKEPSIGVDNSVDHSSNTVETKAGPTVNGGGKEDTVQKQQEQLEKGSDDSQSSVASNMSPLKTLTIKPLSAPKQPANGGSDTATSASSLPPQHVPTATTLTPAAPSAPQQPNPYDDSSVFSPRTSANTGMEEHIFLQASTPSSRSTANNATALLESAVSAIHDMVSPSRVPNSEGEATVTAPQVPMNEHRSSSSGILESTWLWFTMILFAQVYFFQFTIHPLWTTVMELSDTAILVHKNFTAVPPRIQLNETTVEVPGEKPPPIIQERIIERRVPSTKPDHGLITQQRLTQELNKEIQDFITTTSRKQRDIESSIERELDRMRQGLAEAAQKFQVWEQALKDAEHSLDGAKFTMTSDKFNQLWNHIPNANTTRTTLLDNTTMHIPLWTTGNDDASPLESCPQRQAIIADVSVTRDDILVGSDRLKQLSQTLETNIETETKTIVQEWARTKTDQYFESVTSDKDDDQAVVSAPLPEGSLTATIAKAVVHNRLEYDFADNFMANVNGGTDFAAIHNGAQVILDRTSPSLKDTLPLLNRFLEFTKVRFYGYGPEAALTPSVPRGARGQCWSFEKKNGKNRASNSDKKNVGKFATLSVRLAHPIRIGRLIIDHSGQTSSAIRDFRVYGYTQEGRSMNLGEFKLNASK